MGSGGGKLLRGNLWVGGWGFGASSQGNLVGFLLKAGQVSDHLGGEDGVTDQGITKAPSGGLAGGGLRAAGGGSGVGERLRQHPLPGGDRGLRTPLGGARACQGARCQGV